MYFHEWYLWYFESWLSEVYYSCFNWQYGITGSGDIWPRIGDINLSKYDKSRLCKLQFIQLCSCYIVLFRSQLLLCLPQRQSRLPVTLMNSNFRPVIIYLCPNLFCRDTQYSEAMMPMPKWCLHFIRITHVALHSSKHYTDNMRKS